MKDAVIGAMMAITLYGIYFICSLIWKVLKIGTKAIINKTKKKVNLLIIYNIGRKTMNNQKYICGRNENPETRFLCEQEGKDYCMICADTFTEEEYQELYKKHTPVKIADIFFGQEITVPYFNHLV